MTVFALPLVLASFAIGWTLSGTKVLDPPQATPPRPEPVASTTPTGETVPRVVAEEDVPGRDLAGLPRYPGSTRAGYRHERLEGFAKTQAEYVMEADPDEIRTFYRRSFASEGWVVADLGFSPEEWCFFVVKGKREALVEIHALREPVVVEIELTGPDGTPAGETRAPPPTQTAPEPPSGDDGNDVDDGYYEGGDD